MNIIRYMVLTLSLSSGAVLANADVRLLFHMGAGAENEFIVGGTVENKGDSAAAGGVVVIVPVDDVCKTGEPRIASFGQILPGEKKEFRLPFVDTKLYGYRLISFAAYDNMGFPVTTEDETRDIIMKREDETRKSCVKKRG
ncbi:TPA: membrane-associated Zn-dependent protease 1 [Enterobacter asburiae]